jgi:hypothetical protein
MPTQESLLKILDAPVAGSIFVRNEAFFVVKFSIQYTLGGNQYTQYSPDIPQFNSQMLAIPAGATDIFLKVEGLYLFAWSVIFTARFQEPVTKCYKVWGTMFSPQHEEISC